MHASSLISPVLLVSLWPELAPVGLLVPVSLMVPEEVENSSHVVPLLAHDLGGLSAGPSRATWRRGHAGAARSGATDCWCRLLAGRRPWADFNGAGAEPNPGGLAPVGTAGVDGADVDMLAGATAGLISKVLALSSAWPLWYRWEKLVPGAGEIGLPGAIRHPPSAIRSPVPLTLSELLALGPSWLPGTGGMLVAAMRCGIDHCVGALEMLGSLR